MLIALEANGDPIAALVLNAVEKSETFDLWLPGYDRRSEQFQSTLKRWSFSRKSLSL
jgi:hypothetical protein